MKMDISKNLNLHAGEKFCISEPPDLFDKLVYFSSATIFNFGNRIATARDVCVLMTGSDAPTAKQIDRVASSIRKMSKIDLEMNIELDSVDFDAIDLVPQRFIYTGALLPISFMPLPFVEETEDNVMFYFQYEPPLYTYAKKSGKLVSIDSRMFNEIVKEVI